MTLLTELHSARKERLARIESASIRHEQNRGQKNEAPVSPTPASYNERLSALEREVQSLREAVARQADLIIRVNDSGNGATRLVVPPKISEIIDAVCDFYCVTPTQIASTQRCAEIVRPRHIVCYLAQKLTVLSLPTIGRSLGDRDHTTIMHGNRAIRKALQTDQILRDDIEVLELKIAEKALNRETPSGRQVVHKLPVP